MGWGGSTRSLTPTLSASGDRLDDPHFRPLPPVAEPRLMPPPQRWPSDDRLSVCEEPARLHIPGFIRRKRSLSNASKLSAATQSSAASSNVQFSTPASSPDPLSDTLTHRVKRGFFGTFGRSPTAPSRSPPMPAATFEHSQSSYRAPAKPAPTGMLPERPTMQLVDDDAYRRGSIVSVAPSTMSSRSAASSSGVSASSSRRPMSLLSLLSFSSSVDGPDTGAAYISPSGGAYETSQRTKRPSLIEASDDPFARTHLSIGVAANVQSDFPRSPTPGSVNTLQGFAFPQRPQVTRTPTFGDGSASTPAGSVRSSYTPSYRQSSYAPSTAPSASGRSQTSSMRFPAPPPTVASSPAPSRSTSAIQSYRSSSSTASTMTTDTRRATGQATALRSLERGCDFLDLDDDDGRSFSSTPRVPARTSSYAPPMPPLPLPTAPAAHLREARERAQTMTRRTQQASHTSFLSFD